MHAEMKKKPSLDTCSNSNAAPEPALAAAGAKYRIAWVLMTPACLTGRMGVHMVEAAARHQFVIRRST